MVAISTQSPGFGSRSMRRMLWHRIGGTCYSQGPCCCALLSPTQPPSASAVPPHQAHLPLCPSCGTPWPSTVAVACGAWGEPAAE